MGNNVFRRAGLIIACAISITLMGPIASAKVSAPPAKKARPSDAIRFPVTKYKLPNGLTVLISEDHHSPLVSYQQWFRVGSSHEKVGHTGLAHFFEHMMFEGTKKYPSKRFNRLMEINGADFDAFTTQYYTGFYETLPSDQVKFAIKFESDRMHNLIINPKVIKKVREVVEEERRMRYENSVMGTLWVMFNSTLYKTSPYHWPVIGYMKDLNAMKLSEFKNWYKTYYIPNNAVVVVVGDVNTAHVKKLIAKYYGPIPARPLPPFHPTPEAPQEAPRTATVKRNVHAVSMMIGWPGVKAGDHDQYALDMLADIMADGPSSRLYRALVYDTHLATWVSMESDENLLAGDIAITVAWNPGANIRRGIAIIKRQIAMLKTRLVTKDEMKKVRNAELLGYIRGLQTDSSRAQALAYNEIIFHNYQHLFTDLDQMSAVTRKDIQNAAIKYLVPSKMNTVEVVPEHRKGARP